MYRKPPIPPQPQGSLTRGADGVYAYQNLQPHYRPIASRVLMVVLVACYLVQVEVYPFTQRFWIDPALVRQGEWWRIATGAFLHGGIAGGMGSLGILHLLANTYFGWSIGGRIERHIGAARLLVISLFSMVGSGVAVVFASESPTLGFSGVLFGWLAAWLGFHLTPRFPGLRLLGPQRSAFMQMLLANFFISLLPGISLLGHLGGFVTGFAVALVLGLKKTSGPAGTS